MKKRNKEVVARVRAALVEDCVRMDGRLVALLRARTRVAPEVRMIRKLGKSLRGGLCLLGMEEEAGREIQAIGRLLGGDRDAVSRLDTWRRLAWRGDAAAAAAIGGLLEHGRRAADRHPPPEAVAWCLGRSRTVRAALANAAAGDPRPAKTLKQLQRRMVKHCGLLGQRRENDFHEARKSLKNWLGAVRILGGPSPDLAAKADRLAGILGHENDLAVLGTWLKERGFTKHLVPGLWDAVTAARRHQQDRAIARAAALGGK